MRRIVAVVLSVVVAAAVAVPVACALGSRATSAGFDEALRLARVIEEKGCSPKLMGDSRYHFSTAQAACRVFVGAALVSAALDEGRQAEAVPVLDELIDGLLGAKARAAFASTGTVRVAAYELPRSVLYRGWLLLLLGGRARLGEGSGFTSLHDALAQGLSRDLAASKTGLLPTYRSDLIWPCDHAPAASGLALHAALRESEESRKASEALSERLASLAESKRGFPTRVLASGKVAEATPRGTALAFTAGFLLHGHSAPAQEFAARLTRGFCDREAGLAACREWPRGVNRGADSSSGPIIRGYGTGASALAFAAVRALDEGDAWTRGLLGAGSIAGLDGVLAKPATYPLENAIYLWGRTARGWLPPEGAAR